MVGLVGMGVILVGSGASGVMVLVGVDVVMLVGMVFVVLLLRW